MMSRIKEFPLRQGHKGDALSFVFIYDECDAYAVFACAAFVCGAFACGAFACGAFACAAFVACGNRHLEY